MKKISLNFIFNFFENFKNRSEIILHGGRLKSLVVIYYFNNIREGKYVDSSPMNALIEIIFHSHVSHFHFPLDLCLSPI